MSSAMDRLTQAITSKSVDLATPFQDEIFTTDEPIASQNPLQKWISQPHADLAAPAESALSKQHPDTAGPPTANTWQRFEQTRQAYLRVNDYDGLCRLAQDQLQHATTAQERAHCLLMAGQATYHLHQYAKARQQYFDPALQLSGVAPETRAYLAHHLGLCAMAQHDFTAATYAFQRSANILSSLPLQQRSTGKAGQRRRGLQLTNAAWFYQGVIELIHHRPLQARQLFERIQHPATSMDGIKTALYLGLTYRELHLPDEAARVMNRLGRTETLPAPVQTAVAVVWAGVANLQGDSVAASAHLEAALEAPLPSSATWEPSWRIRLYQELGLAFQQTGARQAALACYEESLKLAAYRMGHWQEPTFRQWVRGQSLYIALGNLPLHTASPIIRGEMIRSLQALAWLYTLDDNTALAERAITLALQVAVTPEQCGTLWLERGCLALMRSGQAPGGHPMATDRFDDLAAGLSRAQAQVANTPFATPLFGVAALHQGHAKLGMAAFATRPDIPACPYAQALATALWLWAQTVQGRLDDALLTAPATDPMWRHWQAPSPLGFDMLLRLTVARSPTPTDIAVAWLGPLLGHLGPPSLEALRPLVQPGYLPRVCRHVLTDALSMLLTDPSADAMADELAGLLGQEALLSRIETRLARLDQLMPPAQPPPRKASRRRKPRRHRSTSTGGDSPASGLRPLIHQLHPEAETQSSSPLPDRICTWLRRYPRLSAQAPEVVSSLLTLLGRCPQSQATIQTILDHVPLSKRQHQGLTNALKEPPLPDSIPTSPSWDAVRLGPLSHVLKTVLSRSRVSPSGVEDTEAAHPWYALAIVMSRLGLLSPAIEYATACQQLVPDHPLPHFLLAQLHHHLEHRTAAWHHSQQAWRGLEAKPTGVIHLEVINLILVQLGAQRHYDLFPEWIAAFQRRQTDLDVTSLTPAEQQRVQEEVGEYALAQVVYISGTATVRPKPDTVEQQLDLLGDAIAAGTPSTQHFAWHRQAEILTRQQRFHEAIEVYHHLLKQWPADRRGRLRLSLLTAMQHATSDVETADQALHEALTLALPDELDISGSSLTPQTALAWLQSLPAHTPYLDDMSDVLTTYGGIAVERQHLTDALALLEPLYTLQKKPLQAYYLAAATYAQSQSETAAMDRLRGCDQALTYAAHALDRGVHQDAVGRIIQQAQRDYDQLMADQEKAAAQTARQQQVCDLFSDAGLPVQVEETDKSPEASWLTLAEHLDLDATTGDAVVTIHLSFSPHTNTESSQWDMQAVQRYVAHQLELNRLEETLGISALPWPATPYRGETPFDAVFSARLGFNRDLFFIASCHRPQHLVRYAYILCEMIRQDTRRAEAHSLPADSVLADLARWATTLPLVQHRIQTVLAHKHPTKKVQYQWQTLKDELPRSSWEGPWRNWPAFRDARRYFATIATALTSELNRTVPQPPLAEDKPAAPERSSRRKNRSRRSPAPRRGPG